MFSLSAKLPVAPPVTIEKKERVYHPRTYSDFVKSIKNNELPRVVVKPNQNIALYDDDEGNYGDTQIVQTEQLWQTLMESDTNVMVDMSQPTSLLDYLSTFFLISLAFFLFRGVFSGQGGQNGGMSNPFLKNKEFKAEEDIETRFKECLLRVGERSLGPHTIPVPKHPVSPDSLQKDGIQCVQCQRQIRLRAISLSLNSYLPMLFQPFLALVRSSSTSWVTAPVSTVRT